MTCPQTNLLPHNGMSPRFIDSGTFSFLERKWIFLMENCPAIKIVKTISRSESESE